MNFAEEGASSHYRDVRGTAIAEIFYYEPREPGDPTVVLLDLKLPKLDGLEVLESVKGDPDLRHVPIVMLTSSREEQDLVRSYQLGVNAFVVKPVEFSEFFKAIQDLGVFWAILNEPPPRSRQK